ncbi:DUF11 domain-containing protein [Anatilimnocola floriformis]|uniref:DUF11 domain-containing protein n=1 Tax=Anatilimnocola floriformis TaxID=2948575 RepID=UPI0020C1F136|nr:DUF11 domain-containing protein [Anatilimnocola floriformis]
MKTNIHRALLSLLALPLLTFCSCKSMHVPFRSLLPAGETPATAASNTTAKSAPSPAPVTSAPLAPTKIQEAEIAVRGPAAYKPPRLVQPVGYYPGVNSPAMTLPDNAYTGQPIGHQPGHGTGCPCCGGNREAFRFTQDGTAVNPDPYGGWMPDGIKKPWPADEYICDGGDLDGNVRVKANWDVVGLDPEDTVAHFDTLDGKTEVTESNKVCIYAPRFAAVRKVINPILYEGHERMAGVEKPTRVNQHLDLGLPTAAIQPEKVASELHLDPASTFREQTRGIGVDNVNQMVLARRGTMLHENLKMIQRGEYDAREKAVLAERTQAAVIWQSNQMVQAIIDGQMAHESKGTDKPEMIYTYELQGKPRLRICKVASNCDAVPGDIVEFTLRFDNTGDQKIGNVTVIDHLTPRLEYVKESQSSTVKAEFKIQENPETLVLRWEITDPLEVGQGGIIRFRCRVR